MFKRTCLLPALALFAVCLLAPAAHADPVVITGGTVTTISGTGRVVLSGEGFALNYFGETNPFNPLSVTINTVTLSFGSPTASFNGVTATVFSGGVTFNDSTLTGNIRAFASAEDMFFQRNPLFTIDFTGMGFLTVSLVDGSTQRQFTVAPVATPEPLTLLMFGTGLAGVAALRRRRRRDGQSP